MNAPVHAPDIDYTTLPRSWARIIIDGDNGSGKTAEAKKMAGAFDARVVSLDEHLLENGDVYWNQIRYEELRSAILTSGPRVIIEGVCILKVLAKISITHDYHIFMMRSSGFLGWVYKPYLNERAKPPHAKLTKEIAEYYREFRPFEVCNLIVDR